jgi:hypothetical protein
LWFRDAEVNSVVLPLGGSMRTEIFITCAGSFSDRETHPIPISEWLRVVAADSELRLSRVEDDEALVHWTTHEVNYEEPWFGWWSGSIAVALRDRKTLGKVLQLAQLLQARVFDEHDREYSSTDDFPNGSPSPPPAAPPRLLGNLTWSFPDDAHRSGRVPGRCLAGPVRAR